MVISSTLKRSKETISPFVEAGLNWQISSDLDEIDWGEHEGQKYNPVLVANYKRLISNWKNGKLEDRLPGGESASELIQRVDDFLDSIAKMNVEKILICTHGRTLRCLLCRALNLDFSHMERFKHYNTGLFLVEKMGLEYQLLLKNDVSHLGDDLLPGDKHF